MKSSVYELYSALIIWGVESSMHAKAELRTGLKRGCCCVSGRYLDKPRDAGHRGGMETYAGYSRSYAGKRGERSWQICS